MKLTTFEVRLTISDALACRTQGDVRQKVLAKLKAVGAPVELGLNQQLYLTKGLLNTAYDPHTRDLVVSWHPGSVLAPSIKFVNNSLQVTSYTL